MDEGSSTAALLLLKMPTGYHVTGNIITYDIPTANSPIQWNPSNTVTWGPKIFGLIRQAAALQKAVM